MKKKLLVVCGGQSSEHSISRISCNSVMKHLDKDKYEITLVGIAKDGKWYILKQEDNDLSKDTWLDGAEVVEGVFNLLRSQDVAFPVLHGLYGEDGTIQGLFELAQLPYVGCRVFASSACMDKIFAKKVFESAGIPQVKSVYVKKRNDGRLVVVEKDMEETEEVEAGSIGGEEDGVVGMGECADPKECKMIADLGVDFLAAGIGNIHGKYPANWKGLSFETLAAVQELTGELPLVLHGGTGIPDDMIKKAIDLGVSKINVNTECQLVFAEATRKYIEAGKDLEGKGYDPRKLLKPGADAIVEKVKEKMILFGSDGKAE